MYVLLGNCMFKKCNQEKLSLWHNHCFLCCIDGKMFKWKKKEKKKKHLEKDLFLYKGNFIPCLCTLFFPLFLPWAVVYVVEKLIRRGKRQFTDWKFKVRVVGFGTLVTVSPLFCHFQPVAARWECLLSLLFCLFLKGDWILSAVLCGLFWCSIFHGQKKVIKKLKSELDWRRLILCNVTNALLLTTRYHETYKNWLY